MEFFGSHQLKLGVLRRGSTHNDFLVGDISPKGIAEEWPASVYVG